MKKVLSLILCVAMLVCFAACGAKSSVQIGKTKEFTVGDYKVNLPETYEANDLEEVKAEPDCVAMFTDSKGKLPDLWVYVDDCTGDSLKAHVIALDGTWNFNEFSVYTKNGKTYANAIFDEDWYGQSLINEQYYRLESGNKVLGFDFAYETSADKESQHAYIQAIAAELGF